jgi:hypothetical protein
VLAKHRSELGAQRFAIGDAVLVRAKRGSVPSSGLPISLHNLRKVPSLPTPMKMLSVLVGKIA